MLYLLIPISLIVVYVGKRLWKTGIVYIDPIYIAIRNNGNPDIGPISKGFLRQLVRPWRRGVGVELKVGVYVLHVGVCRRMKDTTSTDATLYNLDGKWLDEDVDTIKGWTK